MKLTVTRAMRAALERQFSLDGPDPYLMHLALVRAIGVKTIRALDKHLGATDGGTGKEYDVSGEGAFGGEHGVLHTAVRQWGGDDIEGLLDCIDIAGAGDIEVVQG